MVLLDRGQGGPLQLSCDELEAGFYIQLLSGRIELSAAADRVLLDASTLRLMNGDYVVASYERSNVLYCSRAPDSLPMI